MNNFRQFPFAIRFIGILSLLLVVSLAFDWIPFLRGGEIFHWQWGYFPVDTLQRLKLIVVLVVYLVVGWGVIGYRRKFIWVLSWAILGTFCVSLTIISLRYEDVFAELFARTVSPTTTGPHSAAATIDWDEKGWHDWQQVMEDLHDTNRHVALSPPALPFFYQGLNMALGQFPTATQSIQQRLLPYQCHNYTLLNYTPSEWSSALFGLLMPLWASLTVIPLYFVSKRFMDEISSQWVVLFWALIPALVMFSSSWNTVYPFITMLAFWLLLKGTSPFAWSIHELTLLILAGFLIGMLTFANFSVVPIIGLFGFYVLITNTKSSVEVVREPPLYGSKDKLNKVKRAVWIGFWFGIGVLLPWGIYYLWSGITPFALLDTAFDLHLALDRPYVPWLWMHFWEWALLSGIPLVLLWLWFVFQRPLEWNQGKVLAISLFLTMLILLLSNTARGETGRVWLFFTPFLLLVAGIALHNSQSPKIKNPHRIWMTLMVVQALFVLVLASTWDVISAPDINPPPSAPGIYGDVQVTQANFADQFSLIGWGGEVRDEAIILHLNWQSHQNMVTPYWFAGLLVDPNGNAVGESIVWQPENGYSTTCWKPDQMVGNEIALPLPEHPIHGDWWVSLRVFADVDDPVGSLLPVTFNGVVDEQLGLGGIPVSILQN